MGFYESWFEQLWLIILYNHWYYVFLLFYVGLYYYVDAFVLEMGHLIDELNVNTLSERIQEEPFRTESAKGFDSGIDPFLIEMIHLHRDFLKYDKKMCSF